MPGYISYSLHVCYRPDEFAVAERPKAFSFFANKETGDWRQPGRRRGCGKHDPDRQLSTPDTAFPFITTDALFTPCSSADGLLWSSPMDTPRTFAIYSQTSPADAACYMQTIYCWLKLEESRPCSTADRLGHHRQHILTVFQGGNFTAKLHRLRTLDGGFYALDFQCGQVTARMADMIDN